jgi:hypothetical protein
MSYEGRGTKGWDESTTETSVHKGTYKHENVGLWL